jgi:hypothetical protein
VRRVPVCPLHRAFPFKAAAVDAGFGRCVERRARTIRGDYSGSQGCDRCRSTTAPKRRRGFSDGINGVRLANAIHLSSWTGAEMPLDFDEDAYLDELNKRIRAEGKFAER